MAGSRHKARLEGLQDLSLGAGGEVSDDLLPDLFRLPMSLARSAAEVSKDAASGAVEWRPIDVDTAYRHLGYTGITEPQATDLA